MPIKDPTKRAEYHARYLRDRYKADPEYRAQHKSRVVGVNKRRREEIRIEIEAFRQDGCRLCPEMDPCCLTAHHLDPKVKEFNIATATQRLPGRDRLTTELAKCICLCENCHRKLHAGRIQLPAEIVSEWSSGSSSGS